MSQNNTSGTSRRGPGFLEQLRCFLVSVALKVPQLKRLHEQRNELLVERNRLQQQLADPEHRLSLDRAKIESLQRELEQHTQFIELPNERVRIPRGWTMGFLSTMPRSGTWYTFYFFEFLFSILEGRSQLKETPSIEVYPAASLVKGHVHSHCPGFSEAYKGSYREAWDQLKNTSGGFDQYDYGSALANSNSHLFSPVRNPRARIVYIYRNPLDQVISHFFHAQKNKYTGDFPRCKDPAEYLRSGALRAYAKQFFTFEAMVALCPENIMMVRYEDLVRNPQKVFREILGYWNFMLDTQERKNAFESAIEQSSMKNLRAREINMGRSLGGDKLNPGDSHMRGGVISGWRSHFSEPDVSFAEAELAKLGLSLSELMKD